MLTPVCESTGLSILESPGIPHQVEALQLRHAGHPLQGVVADEVTASQTKVHQLLQLQKRLHAPIAHLLRELHQVRLNNIEFSLCTNDPIGLFITSSLTVLRDATVLSAPLWKMMSSLERHPCDCDCRRIRVRLLTKGSIWDQEVWADDL